ncbi:hypothetical protein AQUSIP_05320 [Aquicella siphonis]|uniref:Glycosyltransferase RgtA/B/C/D-like domain-containing protein n=1 Tax=Aquicella siphonis TaxID=254247 RepID=A0A5E4PEI4_9COXI|nr:glycosyltransferase family 39 protein [Aquicella siphonis]VVC75244.1 hypothetical protein AQUSIP_05320 [Aquicella siphonis]
MMYKTLKDHRIVLLLAMLGCGWLSLYFGKELCWDLAHYHYYSPFALLNGRRQMDYWPNSYIHQFINPAIDLFSYFLISQMTPRMSEFILGAAHGINLWLLFLIARRLIQEPYAYFIAVMLAFMGLCGPTVLPGIGSFQNDNLVAVFVLGFVLLQLQCLSIYQQSERLSRVRHVLSGVILGLGFGLKLTAGIYIAGGIAAALILPVPFGVRLKTLCLWGAGCAAGMLVTNGYWMAVMWESHRNPFFPFFNNFFHSPDFIDAAWRDKRFLPSTLSQILFFPFYFAWDGRTADAPFRDLRFPVIYILFVWIGLQWIKNKFYAWRKKNAAAQERAAQQETSELPLFLLHYWLFAFFIFSYIVWQYYFSIARYLAALEMLAPLIIYLLIQQMVRNKILCYASVFLVFYILLYFLSPIPMVRAPWYDSSFFNVKLPSLIARTPRATVLMTYTAYVMDRDPRPQTYLIPFFPRGWRFIGVPFWHRQYLEESTATENIRARLRGQHDPLFLLTSDAQMPALYQTVRRFDLMPAGKCEKIYSDRQAVTHQNVLLCPVVSMNGLRHP